MDYPCAKFGDCTFIRFGFIVRTSTHTDRQTHIQNHINTDAANRYTHATVGVTNKLVYNAS